MTRREQLLRWLDPDGRGATWRAGNLALFVFALAPAGVVIFGVVFVIGWLIDNFTEAALTESRHGERLSFVVGDGVRVTVGNYRDRTPPPGI